MHTVFVYGTLMRGFWNHRYHLSNQVFVGESRTADPAYWMIGGGFPYVIRVPEGERGAYIAGEVYRVDDQALRGLDLLEGNGSHYTRAQVALQDKTQAWMYLVSQRDNPRLYQKIAAQLPAEPGNIIQFFQRAEPRSYEEIFAP